MKKSIKNQLRFWWISHWYYDYGQSGWEGHRVIIAKDRERAMKNYIEQVFHRPKNTIKELKFSAIEGQSEVWIVDYEYGYDIIQIC